MTTTTKRFTVAKLKAMPYIKIEKVSVIQLPSRTYPFMVIHRNKRKDLLCNDVTQAVAYANSLLEGGK